MYPSRDGSRRPELQAYRAARDYLSAGQSAANPPHAAVVVDRWNEVEKLTDRRTLDRFIDLGVAYGLAEFVNERS